MSISYAALKARHDEYTGNYWRELRALTNGGMSLFGDDAVLTRLLPRNGFEREEIYEERKRRALYFPYPGEMVSYVTSQFVGDPLRFTTSTGGALPEWCSAFVGEMAPRLSAMSIAQHLAREALITRRAWALVDLPEQGPEAPASLLDQERTGALRPFVTLLPSESVVDWEYDDRGELLWAIVAAFSKKRLNPRVLRKDITEVYTIYTREGWERFEITRRPEESISESRVIEGRSGTHPFGRVPLVCLTLKPELWMLDKLARAAIAFLNQRSGLSWAQLKTLYPVLVAFLAPEETAGGLTATDSDRASGLTYGPGYVNELGAQDRLEYIAPSSDAFSTAAADLTALRDEMHRVAHSMALATDNGAAALFRSAESKGEDRAVNEVLARAVGAEVRLALSAIVSLAAAARGEQLEFTVAGLEKFTAADVTNAIVEAPVVIGLGIPSQTFYRHYFKSAATKILANTATADVLAKVHSEIEAADIDPAELANGAREPRTVPADSGSEKEKTR